VNSIEEEVFKKPTLVSFKKENIKIKIKPLFERPYFTPFPLAL